MNRTPDNAILASVIVTVTLKLCRKMDKGDAMRTRTYLFPLSMNGVGSADLHALPQEMQMLGGEVIAKTQSWEGGPRTPVRAVIDPLTRALQQRADAPSQMEQLIHAAAAGKTVS